MMLKKAKSAEMDLSKIIMWLVAKLAFKRSPHSQTGHLKQEALRLGTVKWAVSGICSVSLFLWEKVQTLSLNVEPRAASLLPLRFVPAMAGRELPFLQIFQLN